MNLTTTLASPFPPFGITSGTFVIYRTLLRCWGLGFDKMSYRLTHTKLTFDGALAMMNHAGKEKSQMDVKWKVQ